MKRPSIRPYTKPKTAHHQFQFARALDILEGRRKGITFAVLAQKHGVTVARIQQIHGQVMRRGGKWWVTGNMEK